MDEADELTTLRRRFDAILADWSREKTRPDWDRGNGVMLGTVRDDGHRPSSLPGRFSVTPTEVSGADTEGAAPAITTTGDPTVFTVFGTTVPGVGEILTARLIDGYWCAERSGGGCRMCIAPTGPCGPLLGATVKVYNNVDRSGDTPIYGAFLDPAANNTLYGTGTIGSGSPSYCLSLRPGLYMVETDAPGYATDYRFAYACTNCGTISPKLAVGQTVTLATDGLGVPLTGVLASANPLHYLLTPITGGTTPLVNDGSAVVDVPSVGSHVIVSYGFPTCSDDEPTTGTNVRFDFGCLSPSGPDIYYFVDVFLSKTHGFPFAASTGLCGIKVTFRVRGRVTGITLGPMTVTGTWESYYDHCYFGFGSGHGDVDLAPGEYPHNPYSIDPAHFFIVPPPPPVTGDFTVS